jgi:hypothetical protein
MSENVKINAGDLVRLDRWFSDIYAEVIDAFSDGSYIVISRYNKAGTERWTDLVNCKTVANVVPAEVWQTEQFLREHATGRFSLADKLLRWPYSTVQWPIRQARGSRAHSNQPEKLQVLLGKVATNG